MPAFGFPHFLTALWLVLFMPASAPRAAPAPAPPADVPLPAATSAFLQKYVDASGNVRYAALKSQPAELQGLLRRIEAFDPKAATPDERKAFYLNAYNLRVIGAVVEHYPVSSVMKLPGFFEKTTFLVGQERMTLNGLETNKLRKPYKDPRVHFALVCGAKGCPRLSREAYAAATLDAQLTAQAQRVLTTPSFVRVDEGAKKVLLSEIFKWYEADFKATGKSAVAYINQFRGAQPIPAAYAVDYYPYDWALNDQQLN